MEFCQSEKVGTLFHIPSHSASISAQTALLKMGLNAK